MTGHLNTPAASPVSVTGDALPLDLVVAAIARYRFRHHNEAGLQEALASALTADGFDVEREVRLNARDRIDLLVGRVGVEVKTAGAWAPVVRQLGRYSESDRIGALVLVTARAQLARMPLTINHVPVRVVNVARGSL